jgi:hypothetical protein
LPQLGQSSLRYVLSLFLIIHSVRSQAP